MFVYLLNVEITGGPLYPVFVVVGILCVIEKLLPTKVRVSLCLSCF